MAKKTMRWTRKKLLAFGRIRKQLEHIGAAQRAVIVNTHEVIYERALRNSGGAEVRMLGIDAPNRGGAKWQEALFRLRKLQT